MCICMAMCKCVSVSAGGRCTDTTDRQGGGGEKDGKTVSGRRAAFARSDSAAVGPRHLSRTRYTHRS